MENSLVLFWRVVLIAVLVWLIAGAGQPVTQSVDDARLVVTTDMTVGKDVDTLIAVLEFAVWAPEDLVAEVIFLGMLEGELEFFENGDVVYPTGRVDYYNCTDGQFKIIEVRNPRVGGWWWMFAMHTDEV